MVPCPSSVAPGPAEAPVRTRRMWSCRPAGRSSAAAPVGAGVRAGFLLATCVRSFPAPARFSAEGKNFSLVTPPGIAVRNSLPAWVKSRLQLGAREPGTPGWRAAPPRGRGRRPPRAAEPRAAHGGRGRGARPAWAALGLRPHSRAARVLSRVRRPRPAPARPPPLRAGADRPRRLEGDRPSGGPTGRPCLCHSRSNPPGFPPPSLRSPPSSFPAVAAAAARSPRELAGPRRGPRLRRAPPRHLHSRAGDGEGRRGGGEKGGGGPGPGRGGGSFCFTGLGGNSATAPAAKGAEAARGGGGGDGGGAGSRGGAPTAHSQAKAGASQSARTGSTRSTSAAGGAGRGPRAGGEARGGRPATHPPEARAAGLPSAPHDPARPPPPGPIEFLCTTVIGAKRLFECSPDFQAAGISFSCSTPTPLMARSGCRKPPPLLRAASSHAGPASELAASGDAAGGPSEETKLVLGGGERGPRNCLKTVPLLEETLDALRAPRSLPAPTLSGVQSFSQSRWPW
eukprot:XP_006517866.1 PREDICTED: translation initiation factor IF-2 [Mus musculus]